MKLMRNTRTGRQAVYDEALVATGNWEPVEDAPKPAPAPAKDAVKVKDKVKVAITRTPDEGLEHQA